LLLAAIRSVQAQTYPAIQLIVIDDGSTDKTQELLAGVPGVEYYYQANKGQAAARNAGLTYCRGEFIASLDSDDVWEPDFLATGMACMQKHQLDFAFLNWKTTNGNTPVVRFFNLPGKKQSYWTQPDGEWWVLAPAQTRQLFIETCPAPSSGLIIRRTSLQPGAWNEEMLIADDWCLVLDMVLARPCRSAFTMTPHWLKYVHGSNIYDGRDELDVIRELGFHDEKLLASRFHKQLSRPERLVFRHRMAEYYFNFAYHSWKRTAPKRTIASHLAQAFLLAPLVIVRTALDGLKGKFKKHLAPAGRNAQ